MVTTVESPGIASAKEEAAAILFARETQTQPVVATAAPEPTLRLAPEPAKQPTFASYHNPEPMPSRPQAVKTENLRPYEVYEEVKVEVEPQVVRPYIDSSDYLASAAAVTSVATPTATTVEAPKTVVVEQSALDTELEEDTQYVVKFKNSTIVAATILATIFLLMAVLVVVNIVSLVTTAAEVNALYEESNALHQTLTEEKSNVERARREATANGGSSNRTEHIVSMEHSTGTVTSSSTANSSFFDWLCRALSQLFN